MNFFSLKDMNILISGSTGHLGKEIAYILASNGANVLINGRSEKNVYDVVNSIKTAGYNAYPAVFNVTSELEVKKYFDEFKFEYLNGIINNASIISSGSIEYQTLDDFKKDYEISVLAPFLLIRNSLDFLKVAVKLYGDASVLNISSIYGNVSPDLSIYDSKKSANAASYGVGKAALMQLTRYAAIDFSNDKIRFNSISPGAFPKKINQEQWPELMNNILKKIPLMRLGVPEDLAGPVIFFMSKASKYITGVNLPVDGGWLAT